jgi:hypothetical protein
MPRSPHHHARHPESPLNQQRNSPDFGRGVPEPELREQCSFSPAIRYPDLDRFPQERAFYKSDRHDYQLRQSEIYTMAEAGKFRVVSLEDLESHVYSANREMMNRDLNNLERQELIRRGASRYPDHLRVVTLTSRGKKVLQKTVGRQGQEFYSGFKKVRELRHDMALYRIYQAKAQEIQDKGGKIKRVILDYEMKGKVNRDLGKANGLDPAEEARLKEAISQKHDIPVVSGSFVVPDVRLEYEDRDGNECRVDLEYLTETYRDGEISAKARAGFTLYAPHDQAPRLHRVLDQHHIMTEILSL